MNARLNYDGSAVAWCPSCGALASFEYVLNANSLTAEVVEKGPIRHGGAVYSRAVHRLLRCANCGRGALAVILDQGGKVAGEGTLVDFFPYSIDRTPLPNSTPKDIVAEVREAERCAAIGAWRAASAMLRSALEKTLKANGYTKGTLADKINEAGADGVITAARQQRAHDEVRDLGNDILHDAWRVVSEDEFKSAHLYTQRVIEDFYDSRKQVEAVLIAKKRMTAAPKP